jgi:hypothetical protein
MKKVIKGKVYDTETTQRLAEYAPNPYRSDFHYFCETLYRKKTGEYFIHGEGNAASKYAQSCGQNEWCGGEKIIPLTYADAQAWAEKHLDGDEYIEIFGEPEEDEEKAQIHINLSKGAISKLKQAAQKNGLTVSAYIEQLISDL